MPESAAHSVKAYEPREVVSKYWPIDEVKPARLYACVPNESTDFRGIEAARS